MKNGQMQVWPKPKSAVLIINTKLLKNRGEWKDEI